MMNIKLYGKYFLKEKINNKIKFKVGWLMHHNGYILKTCVVFGKESLLDVLNMYFTC